MARLGPIREVAPGAVYVRRLPSGRPTFRRIIHIHPTGAVVYATKSGRVSACSVVALLRWAGALRRFNPKQGPLL